MTPTKVFEIVDESERTGVYLSKNYTIGCKLNLKETNDKYLLSREELELIIKNAFNAAREKVYTNDYGSFGYENSKQYLKTIL